MKWIMLALTACLSLVAGAASAHGPARLKTDQQVLLAAPIAEVWAAVGSFTDMSWLPTVTSIEATGNEKGATRSRVVDGVTVGEELLKLDEKKHAISVRLSEDNLDYVKATNYALHITLKEEGDKTLVEMKGAFYRANPLNDPPADQNDEASTQAVEALHQGMMEALVAKFGAGG